MFLRENTAKALTNTPGPSSNVKTMLVLKKTEEKTAFSTLTRLKKTAGEIN